MANFQKSSGITPSEQYLAKLCEMSFLSLWSYPNIYTDEGIASSRKIGEELCDLLVIFGNNIIIFSDKSCKMTDSGDEQVDWRRWYKRAIHKSAKQIYGAESWIRKFPDRLFVDKNCTVPLPIELPALDSCKIHRVRTFARF